MVEVDLTTVRKRAVVGVAALTSRTFIIQLLAFGATFLLTIFLNPAVFGIFYVISAIISFLNYFSDIGLAAALIQKKDDLTREDLVTTFTIQQGLVTTAVIVTFAAAPYLASFYRLDQAGLWLLRALVIAFFLSSLKTIPSVLLERQLAFEKLVIPQILETAGFYLVAVLLAWQGYGIVSFTWAVLVRAVVGLLALYTLCPWVPALGIYWPKARGLLRFGLPFQLNSFLALLKDDLLTIFLGKILPFTEVGYIGWAKKWAEAPLRLVMDNVIRVTFPAFSRLQQDKKALRQAIEATLFGLASTIFPLTVFLFFFIEPAVAIIPRYTKWEPALFSFYLLAITSAAASLSTPLTNALNAVGKIKVTLWLMVLWTVTTWILTIIFVRWFGFNGVAMALLTITSSLVIVVTLVKRVTPFSFWSSIAIPLLAALAQATVYALGRASGLASTLSLVITALVGAILYGGILWHLARERIRSIVK